MQPFGADQELLVALRTEAGDAWGMLSLDREAGRPLFDDDELDLLRRLSPYLAQGAKRGLLLGETSDPEGPDTPGLVVLRDDWSVESALPGSRAIRAARRRLGESWQTAALGARGCGPRIADRRA